MSVSHKDQVVISFKHGNTRSYNARDLRALFDIFWNVHEENVKTGRMFELPKIAEEDFYAIMGFARELCKDFHKSTTVEMEKQIKTLRPKFDLYGFRSFALNAIANGDIELLEWSLENGSSFNNNDAQMLASSGGFIHIFEWLLKNGFSKKKTAIAYAAHYGKIDCLVWLRKNKFPWDAYACALASEGGSLECLIWLRDNGCPWDYETTAFPSSGGERRQACIKWAIEHGCPHRRQRT